MARLAWFTPLPPLTSGVAQYNADLLPGLTATHQIDLLVDGPPSRFAHPDIKASVFNAHDFVWMHFRRPYDLVVYQLGNAPCHDYMWAYLVRYPGMVVLHDSQIHHARALWLRRQNREDDYRDEFQFNHPDADPNLAELGIAGVLGPLTYRWPMRRAVVESARLLVVHNHWLAASIREEQPDAQVSVVEMGVSAPAVRTGAGQSVRTRHGIPADAVLFVAFGKVTPEKRISQAIHGLESILDVAPNAHLLLAGEAVDHYDPMAEARALGLTDRVKMAGFVPHDDVPAYLDSADVCLCMRWPSSRETSAAWLRCLAAARPTVITDLMHTVDVPTLDPRSWKLLPVPPAEGRSSPAEPACVSIDILDEDHSLRLAMRRLATDSQLRETLGRNAHELWLERHTLDEMVAGYLNVIEAARALPPTDPAKISHLPAHFLTSGTEHAVRLLRQLELSDSRIDQIWGSLAPRGIQTTASSAPSATDGHSARPTK